MAAILIFFFLHQISVQSLSNPTGFTTNFIHRDFSPLSPFYNPSLTQFHRLHTTIRRSFSRKTNFEFSSSPNTIHSRLSSIPGGDYLMNISIGTPPVVFIAVADTGSDLIWTQCRPCSDYFKQKSPIFYPKHSSSYRSIPCNSTLCIFSNPDCNSNSDVCKYSGDYFDGSVTSGEFSVEKFSLTSTVTNLPVEFKKVSFGCGYDNHGTFPNTSSGIIGLGPGSISLVSQLAIPKQFSYCLFPINSHHLYTSKISFGTDAHITGNDVVPTPLFIKSPSGASFFYHLNLNRITVGDHSFRFFGNGVSNGDGEGNIAIDSGTTLTFIPPKMYFRLESLLKRSTDAKPVKGRFGFLGLCYDFEDYGKIPAVTFHFNGGADVELPPWATFHKIWEGMVCLTILPSDGLPMIGNLLQANLIIGYDLENYTVSFKRTDCTNQL